MSLETSIRLAGLVARLRSARTISSRSAGTPGWAAWAMCARRSSWTNRRTLGIRDARLVVAAGSGGTLAGLLAGLTLIGSRLRLGHRRGQAVAGLPRVDRRAGGGSVRRLGEPRRFTPEQVPLIEGRTWVGATACPPGGRCGHPPAGAARRDPARPCLHRQGFCRPARPGREGRLRRDEPVIFLHTGGLPALFAFDG